MSRRERWATLRDRSTTGSVRRFAGRLRREPGISPPHSSATTGSSPRRSGRPRPLRSPERPCIPLHVASPRDASCVCTSDPRTASYVTVHPRAGRSPMRPEGPPRPSAVLPPQAGDRLTAGLRPRHGRSLPRGDDLALAGPASSRCRGPGLPRRPTRCCPLRGLSSPDATDPRRAVSALGTAPAKGSSGFAQVPAEPRSFPTRLNCRVRKGSPRGREATAQAARSSRMSSAPSSAPPRASASKTEPNSSALRALSAITFSSMVSLATIR